MVLYRLREASVGYILCAVCVVLLGCVTQAWVIYSVQCTWYCVGCVSKHGLYTLCSVRGTVRLRDSSVGYILRAVCVVLCRLCEQAWVIYSVQCAWYC